MDHDRAHCVSPDQYVTADRIRDALCQCLPHGREFRCLTYGLGVTSLAMTLFWASGYEDRQNYQELLWANLEGENVNENE